MLHTYSFFPQVYLLIIIFSVRHVETCFPVHNFNVITRREVYRMTSMDISYTFVIWCMHHFILLVQYWASTLLLHRCVTVSYFYDISFKIDFHFTIVWLLSLWNLYWWSTSSSWYFSKLKYMEDIICLNWKRNQICHHCLEIWSFDQQ